MILDTYQVNEDSCDYNFDYLVSFFTLAMNENKPVFIEMPEGRTKLLTSYSQFTPALHYSALIHRIVVSKRIDVLRLLDEYQQGLVQWWNVLYEAFFNHTPEIEKMAWNGILDKNQADIFIMFFLHPRLFSYTYTTLCTLPYHTNLYELRNVFKTLTLDPCTNSISKDWMKDKEARDIFVKIRSSHYRADDCLENRYIEYLKEEQEKHYQADVISMFLPTSLNEVVKYVVHSYL